MCEGIPSLTNNTKANEQRGRATIRQGTSSTNEQTRTNNASESHHGQMPVLQSSLDSRVWVNEVCARIVRRVAVDLVCIVVFELGLLLRLRGVWGDGRLVLVALSAEHCDETCEELVAGSGRIEVERIGGKRGREGEEGERKRDRGSLTAQNRNSRDSDSGLRWMDGWT